MRAAVLPLLERAAGKGPREAGGRNGLWCAPSARGCGAFWTARKGPREAGGRNGLWCAPSARGCGARRAAPRAVLRLADAGGGAPSLGAGGRERPPGSGRPEWVVVRPVGARLWCAPGGRERPPGSRRPEWVVVRPVGAGCGARRAAPRAVLRLADEGGGAPSLGAGGREKPPKSRRPEWVVVRPVGAGCGARGGTEGRPAPKPAHPGELKGLLARPFAQGPALRRGKREKRKGVCRRRLLRQTPSFSLSRSVLGMLCAGCSTALPWPVRPARRRRTPPARAPARPRPGPWPHTALPFRSS